MAETKDDPPPPPPKPEPPTLKRPWQRDATTKPPKVKPSTTSRFML